MEKSRIGYLSRMIFLGLLVCCIITVLTPAMARSAWSNNPTAICTASGNQYGLSLAKVDDGYMVAWQDERRVYRDIYAQKFDVDGNMKWIENGRVIAAGNNGEASNHLLFNSQSLSGIISDIQGGAIVLWTEDYSCPSGPCGNVWLTRLHSNGNVQWGAAPSPGVTVQETDTAVYIRNSASANTIAPDGEGGAFGISSVDMWGSWYVFRMDANGAYRSATSNVVGARWASHMIYGGNSNGKDYVYIAWTGTLGGDYGNLQIIKIEDPEVNYPASLDTLQASWSVLSLTSTASSAVMSLISDGEGGAIVAWEDGRNGKSDIFAQKINASGSVQWTANGIRIADVQAGDQRRPQLVSDGDGGAVIVWDDSRTAPTRVYAQHVGADGSVMWALDGIPVSSVNGISPKIIRSDDGAYIIAWFDTDANGGTPDYLRAQKIDAAGFLLWPPDSRLPGTTGVVTSEMYSADFDIASDGSSGLIAVWELGGNIYTRRVMPDGNLMAGSITINAGAAITKRTDVTLTLTAEDNTPGTIQMCISNTSSCTEWTAFASSKSWTLSAGDGTKNVYLWFRDGWGNVNATPYSATIILDTTAPTNGAVTVTPGDAHVTLDWAGFTDKDSGIWFYKVVFAPGAAPASCSAGTKIYKGPDLTFTHMGLTNGTVYYYRVCAKDMAGNMSAGVTTRAKPVPETTPPTGSIAINGGNAATKSRAVTLTLSATDPSGLKQMCISNTGACTSWETYASMKIWTLPAGDGSKTVNVWFKDMWGNKNASPYQDTILLDTVSPTNGVVSPTAGSGQVTLNWSGFADSGSGIKKYKVVFATVGPPASCAVGTVIYNGNTLTYTHMGLTNGMTYYYRVCAKDVAGNMSAGATASAKPQ